MSRTLQTLMVCSETSDFLRYVPSLQKAGYHVSSVHTLEDAVMFAYENRIDNFLICSDIPGWETLTAEFHTRPWFTGIPSFLLLDPSYRDKLTLLKNLLFDDYIISRGEDLSEELLLRMVIRERRLNSYLNANPLTHLPGNILIMQEIQNRLDSPDDFTICYVDLDNFKAFNDSYGFAAGDDLIRMTARILTNVVRKRDPEESFVGHIGGDDFIYILAKDEESCAAEIIEHFDLVSKSLLLEEDLARGSILVENRKGLMESFPLPTISIAGIQSKIRRPRHLGEVAALTGEMKKKLKRLSGSNFMFERRVI